MASQLPINDSNNPLAQSDLFQQLNACLQSFRQKFCHLIRVYSQQGEAHQNEEGRLEEIQACCQLQVSKLLECNFPPKIIVQRFTVRLREMLKSYLQNCKHKSSQLYNFMKKLEDQIQTSRSQKGLQPVFQLMLGLPSRYQRMHDKLKFQTHPIAQSELSPIKPNSTYTSQARAIDGFYRTAQIYSCLDLDIRELRALYMLSKDKKQASLRAKLISELKERNKNIDIAIKEYFRCYHKLKETRSQSFYFPADKDSRPVTSQKQSLQNRQSIKRGLTAKSRNKCSQAFSFSVDATQSSSGLSASYRGGMIKGKGFKSRAALGESSMIQSSAFQKKGIVLHAKQVNLVTRKNQLSLQPGSSMVQTYGLKKKMFCMRTYETLKKAECQKRKSRNSNQKGLILCVFNMHKRI